MKESVASYYGKGGILSESAQDTLINSAYKHDCEDADILLEGLHKADLAHSVMLIEEGVIPLDEGKILLKGLLELEKIPLEEFTIDPAYGDVYNSKTLALTAKIDQVANWVHIGRARREAVNIAYLIRLKNELMDLMESLIVLAQSLLETSKKHHDTIMPDFTYLHHAHPTNFAHYILTFVYPLLRDGQRLKNIFSSINHSPAGSGSVNGSRLPLNRERLKELLNFQAITSHTRDAMWQADTPIEAMSTLVTIMTNMNRFADELQVWNTSEFNMVELPDTLCRASVIMPQKRNPYPLAYIRGVTSSLLGKVSSYSAYGKIPSGNPDSRIFIYGDLPRSVKKTSDSLILFSAVLEGFEMNKELLLQRVKEDYSYATDIADHIVMHEKINYRLAHQIVGATIKSLVKEGLKGNEIHIKHLNTASQAIISRSLLLSEDQLQTLINPHSIVQSRKTSGGACEDELKKMQIECEKQIGELITWHQEKKQYLNFAQLDKSVNAVLNS